MDPNMASFVGTIGPGQILDRDSLVAIPAGFAKVIICNNPNNLCIFVSELKEGLDEPRLDIKISIKAFLTVGHEVAKSVAVTSEVLNRVLPHQELSAVSIDKSPIFIARMTREDKALEREILQICIHASKKKTSKKYQIGYVTIDLSQLCGDDRYFTEAWYKIFPSSSHIPGISGSGSSDSRRCRRNRSTSVASFSYTSSPIMAFLMSLPSQRQSLSASMFRYVEDNSFSPETIKRDSIGNSSDASASVEIDGDRVSVCSSATLSVCSTSTNESFHDSSTHQNTTSVFRKSNTQPCFSALEKSKSRSSLHLQEKKKRFSIQLHRRSIMQASNMKRCEEVICREDVDTVHEESFVTNKDQVPHLSKQNIEHQTDEPSLIKSYLSDSDISYAKQALESKLGNNSAVHEEMSLADSIKNTGAKTISYFRTWAQTFSNKLKTSFSPPITQENERNLTEKKAVRQSVSSTFDDAFDDHEHDNTYSVLKFVQTLPKSPNSPSCSVDFSSFSNKTGRISSANRTGSIESDEGVFDNIRTKRQSLQSNNQANDL